MKKILTAVATVFIISNADAQINVDITTGYDNANSQLFAFSNSDDQWELYDASSSSYIPANFTSGWYPGTAQQIFPQSSCGNWIWSRNYSTGPGHLTNWNPGNNSYQYEYKLEFQNNTGCALTNARIELNQVGAAEYMYFELNGNQYNINPTLSSCNGPTVTAFLLHNNVTVPLNSAHILPGNNVLKVFVCSSDPFYGGCSWFGGCFMICGSLKADNAGDPNLIPVVTASSVYCSGTPIVVNGTSGTTSVTNHYWEMIECYSNGAPVPGGYVWSNWYAGAPAGSFAIPNSSSAPCGRYYKIKLALQNNCTVWVENSAIIYLNCAPTLSITGPASVCYGQSVTYTVTGGGRRATYIWSTGSTTGSTTITVTANTVLSVTVTALNGCSSVATYTVNVNNTNPAFTVTTNSVSPFTYYTVNATPVVTTGLPAGFGYAWIVEEVGPPPTYTPVAGTLVSNPSIGCWWTMSCNFNGYNGTSTYPSTCVSTPGQFTDGHYYRITRGTWSAACPWTQHSVVVFVCNSCREGGELIVKEDANAPSYEEYALRQLPESRESLNVYPNPSNGVFEVELDHSIENGSAELISVTGQVVHSIGINSTDRVTINTSGLAAGIYTLRITNADRVMTERIIIE